MAQTKIQGEVTSTAMDKTIVVTQVTRETHPLYGKKYTKQRKFKAHDAKNEAKVGDTVIIAETKPISKTVSFTLEKIVAHAHEALEVKEEKVVETKADRKEAAEKEAESEDK